MASPTVYQTPNSGDRCELELIVKVMFGFVFVFVKACFNSSTSSIGRQYIQENF
jgi:hypothetical protein